MPVPDGKAGIASFNSPVEIIPMIKIRNFNLGDEMILRLDIGCCVCNRRKK